MRGNASKYANAQETRQAAEMRLFTDLNSTRAEKRHIFSVDWIERNYNVTRSVAAYRLGQAQARWAAE
jgi:hypothetical protein